MSKKPSDTTIPPTAGLSLDEQINALDLAINTADDAAQQLLQIVSQTPAKIAAANNDRSQAFGRPDEAEVEQRAREDVQAAHQAHDEAVVKLKSLAADVQGLEDRREQLRQTAVAEVMQTIAERDRIARKLSEANIRSSVVDGLAAKIGRVSSRVASIERSFE